MKLNFLDKSRRARLLDGVVIAGHFIRAGFVFNGANIPIWVIPLVWLTRWHPKIRRAACIHDYWWYMAELCKDQVEAARLYRKGNALFREVLRVDGCNGWQTWACYNAVRMAGWFRLRRQARERNG